MTLEPHLVWKLPVPSQEFLNGPIVWHDVTKLQLHYDYETEVPGGAWGRLDFEGVVGFRYTAPAACTVEQIDTYDQVVEILDSPWLPALVRASAELPAPPRHLCMYFDDIGCYEVAATSFTPHPVAEAPPRSG